MKHFIFWGIISLLVLGALRTLWFGSEIGQGVLILLGAALGFYLVHELKSSFRLQREGYFGDLKGEIAFWILAILIASLIIGFIGGWPALFIWGFGLLIIYLLIDC